MDDDDDKEENEETMIMLPANDDGDKPPYTDLPSSRAMLHEETYIRLRDAAVLSMISNSTDRKLRKARKVVKRFQSRDLYKMAAKQALDCELNEHDKIIWGKKEDGQNNGLMFNFEKVKYSGLSEKEIEDEMLQVAIDMMNGKTTLLTTQGRLYGQEDLHELRTKDAQSLDARSVFARRWRGFGTTGQVL
jgi:hypothetical protein